MNDSRTHLGSCFVSSLVIRNGRAHRTKTGLGRMRSGRVGSDVFLYKIICPLWVNGNVVSSQGPNHLHYLNPRTAEQPLSPGLIPHSPIPRFSPVLLHAVCFAPSSGRSPLFGHFSTTLLGLDTIRAFGVEQIFAEQMHSYQDAHSRAWFTFIATSSWLGWRMDLLCVAFISFVALVSPALKDCKLDKPHSQALKCPGLR